MKTREECIKGIVSGGALAGIMGIFMLITSDTGAVPVTNVGLRGTGITAAMIIELVIMFIGIGVMLSNISSLGKINGTGSNCSDQAGGRTQKKQNPGTNAKNVTYTYCYCGQCGRKLKLANARGRVEAICPVCGHKTLINC